MVNKELFNFFVEDNKSGYKLTERWLKNNKPELYFNIINDFKEFNIPFKEMVWLYVNNIKTPPTCPVCDKTLKMGRGFKEGYPKYCSITCSNKSEHTKQKKRNRFKQKDDAEKRKIVESRKKTNIKRYGVNNPFKSIKIQNKKKETILKKYGVDNVFKLDEVKEKIKTTNLIKYGVEHLSKDKEYHSKKIDKIKTHCKEKLKKNILEDYSNTDFDVHVDDDMLYFLNLCDKHNIFKISKNNFHSRKKIGKNICTKCFPINELSSFAEKEINNFIKTEINLSPIKIKIEGSEIDVYIPTRGFGIEYNGLYWHSDRYVDKNYHLLKTKKCERNNIKLLQIFEDEWRDKEDIVKSIIKNKLGVSELKIYARKTIIKEVSPKEAVKFLNENHIQGFVGSNIKLGLYYKDELVSLMTFGKKRVSMGSKSSEEGEYEMLRFCNKINTSVVGGASKLLRFFEINYKPKSILSFADRRYSDGNLYDKLGFDFIGETKPNYFYFEKDKNVRRHRFKFRKDALIKEGYDPNKSEREIMEERGFLRIYDCGQLKYQKKY